MVSVESRSDYNADGLRAFACKSSDAKQARRLMALAGVADGLSRADAAAIRLMDRQTLRDWVHRFNADGPDSLIDRKSPGPKPRLSPEPLTLLRETVAAGPDLDKDGVVRWRCADLAAVIKTRFGVKYHESSVGKLLRSLGFSLVSARPRHPEQDPETIEVCKKTSHSYWRKA
jgi:transposase